MECKYQWMYFNQRRNERINITAVSIHSVPEMIFVSVLLAKTLFHLYGIANTRIFLPNVKKPPKKMQIWLFFRLHWLSSVFSPTIWITISYCYIAIIQQIHDFVNQIASSIFLQNSAYHFRIRKEHKHLEI